MQDIIQAIIKDSFPNNILVATLLEHVRVVSSVLFQHSKNDRILKIKL